MTGEPVHATLEERMVSGLLFSSEDTFQLWITERAKWPLCFVFSYVQPVKNEEHYEKDLCNQSSYNRNSLVQT